jgi:hypothetical protein
LEKNGLNLNQDDTNVGRNSNKDVRNVYGDIIKIKMTRDKKKEDEIYSAAYGTAKKNNRFKKNCKFLK